MGTLNYFKDGVWVSSDDPAGTIPQDVADQINDLVERPTVTYGSAPVSPKAGDVWIDSEGNKTKVFDGTVWVIAQDTDISGLAGSKNRVFLSPSTPIGTTGYTPVNGDLWIDSDDDNKIYIYNNTKFDVAPLGSAALADSLQTTINTASSQAASATSAIGDILSDDKVTPDEKYRLAKEWAVIDAERAGMASQATTYGIDQTDFNTATTSLDMLLNNATNGILLNMSSTSTISGQSVRVAFTDYYAQRTALLNAIYAKVKSIADSKTRAYYSDTMPTGLSFVNGDIWFDTNDDNRIYIYEDGFVPVEFGINALARGTITKNTFGSDTTISNLIGVPTTTYSDLYNGFVTVAGAANSIRLNNVITENGSWTFSCMARRTGGAGNITVDICDGGTLTFTMGTDWSSVVLTHDVANFGASCHFVDIAFSAAGTFEFKQVQVEKGTRSTEWVPSATDLTNRIYQVKLSADSKNNIYYADVAPSSEIDNPYRTGDTWYHMVDVGGVKGIDGIWHFDATKGTGLKWSKEVLQNGVFGQLDAAKITTGFLSASRIDAGTITADKVVLSSGANLLQDPGFSKAELWDTTTCTVAPTAGMAGGPAAQLVTHATTPKYVHGLVERLNVARVIEGSNYRAGIWVKASNTVLASKIKLYGSWMDSKTAIKGTWNIVYGSALAANTWTHLSGLTGPVPSGASFSSFGLEVAATTAGVTITVSEPFLQQAAGAELIVDGAITTDKLSANAVTAAKIKANTITVNELASDVGTGLILSSNTAITAKVSKDDVINQINLSPEDVTISGNKINIDGALEISNWASGEDSTKIDGGSIYANSITANKLASDVGTGLDISSNDSITSRVTSTDMDAAINKLVMSITDYYALSTNPTTPPASGWGTTVPTWTDGSYIWHRQTILYKDTTSTETSPVNITGAMGKTGAAAINVLLSNESCSVPADNSGNVTSYVSTGTTINVYEGATELTYDGIGTNNGFWKVTSSGSNITPSSPTDSGMFATYGDHSAMALGSNTALITYTISGKRTNGTDFSILRSQNFTKSKAGSDGAASTSYWLVSDTLAIAKNVSNVYTPASITVSGKAQTGLNAPAAYAGRFIIAESTDGSTYVDKYPSAANESSKTYTPSAGIKSVRIRMYLAGGTTTLLDEMIVPIVNDGATGSRTAVLTMYKWSAASPTAYPSGTASTYTWANGTFTDPGTLNGWSRTIPAKVSGQTLWGISKTYTDTSTTATSSVTWNSTSPFAIGYAGTDGTNAKLISLTATTQTLTAPTTGGVTTPATAVVTGTAQATTITSWEYSVDGAAFSATVPTGVSRTNNVVTITGQTMTAKTIAVKMSDGTVSDTLTVAKVTDGATGATGQGIDSITEEYYLSTSKTTQTDGSWVTNPPTWSMGKYIWTRSKIVYKNPASTVYTTPIVSSEWEAANDVKDLVYSKGTDLVTNGTAYLGNNTNFTNLIYSGADAPTGASGSFYAKSASAHGVMIDELIPFDPSKKYKFGFQMRQTVPAAVSRAYGFIAPYDISKRQITPEHYMFIPDTLTTLAAPLNPGDTTITLTNSANWYGLPTKPAGANTYQRSIIFWDYVDDFGKAWPELSYSRNIYSGNRWADGGINATTHVITLSAAYNGPAKAAGTKLSNGSAGGAYVYMPSCTNVVVPETWTTYADVFSAGIKTPTGTQAAWSTGLPPGTASIKVGWLLNYPSGGGKHAIAAVSFSDASAATSIADTSVKSTDVEYYLSTSATSPTGGSWTTTAMAAGANQYIWTRTKTVLNNGTTTYVPSSTGALIPTGLNAFTTYLTNEAHTFAAATNGDISNYDGGVSGVRVFYGATELTCPDTTTTTPTVDNTYKVTSIALGTGTITVTGTAPSGQYVLTPSAMTTDFASKTITIVARVRGINYTFTKNLSYSKSKIGDPGAKGDAGAAGKVANIIASSQIFKSTDGGIVFSPDSIVLTPSLQIVTYSKWQYSTNGGTTWIDAESGYNGITIGTVNAVANCLTLVKTSALYTSAITSVVFKLVTNDTAVSDTVTISKLYDVADLKIGASNLVKNTSYLLTDATDGAVLGLGGVKVVGADPKTHTGRVSEALPAPPTGARSLYINNTSPSVENTSGVMQLIYGKVIANTNLILSFYTKASTAGSAWVKICNDNFSIVSAKKTFNLTTDWQLTSIDMGTIPTAAENMRLMFGFDAAIPALGDNGHLISSIMLEYGTKPTNWFPAPQDFIDSIAAQTIISDTIKSEVLQTKALADTTARLLAEFDTEVSNTYSSVEQTSEAININLTTFYANTLSKTMTDIENTFRFTADGLKIAKSTSPYKVSIDNDSLDFLHIDPVSRVESEKATISGDGMKIPDAYISNSLHVGYHQVVKFDTGDAGNTVFRWIGEQ